MIEECHTVLPQWTQDEGVSMTGRDIRFDEPLYTVAEAARMIDVPPSTLATWTKGYLRDRAGLSPAIGEAVVTAFPAEGRSPSIPLEIAAAPCGHCSNDSTGGSIHQH